MRDTTARTETWMWLAQRISAMVLSFCIIVHIATMIIATQGGVSTAEISDRISGNVTWLVFYSIFIAAVSVHAPIGLRTVLLESTPLTEKRVGLLTMLFGLFVIVLGMRTIYGLYSLGGAT